MIGHPVAPSDAVKAKLLDPKLAAALSFLRSNSPVHWSVSLLEDGPAVVTPAVYRLE
jgi:hypothetical protein